MPIFPRQVALAAALLFAITTCAQPPAASTPAVTPSATHRDHAEPAPLTSAKEAPAMSEPATAEPERGPAIPAAELRRRLLALFESFRSLNDLERAHVEQLLQVPLSKDPEMRMGFGYDSKTMEGWGYGVSVGKLYRLDQPSTIVIELDNGIEPFTNQQPTYCTLEFEPLARELVAMGYEQDSRAYNRGGDMTWGFGKGVPEHKAGFGIDVLLYGIRAESGRVMTCIKGFRIGGGVYNG